MSWSYGNDPENDTGDALRLLIFDTDTTDQLLSDEEVDYFINTEQNIYAAAARACQSIASKYARKVDKSVGDLSIKFSQRSKMYAQLAEDYDKKGTLSGGTVFAGGISKSDKQTRNADSDRVKPRFRRNQYDNPDAIQDDTQRDVLDWEEGS